MIVVSIEVWPISSQLNKLGQGTMLLPNDSIPLQEWTLLSFSSKDVANISEFL